MIRKCGIPKHLDEKYYLIESNKYELKCNLRISDYKIIIKKDVSILVL